MLRLSLSTDQLRCAISALSNGAEIVEVGDQPYAVLKYGEAGFLVWRCETGSSEYNVNLQRTKCMCPIGTNCKHILAVDAAYPQVKRNLDPRRGK